MTSSIIKCGVFKNNSLTILNTDAEYASVELYIDYPEGLLTFACVCCVIFMIIGIPGNLITLVALVNYKKVHNATAVFIINMTCADLLLLCLGPPVTMSTYWRRSWTHGRVLCRLYSLGKLTLCMCSISTVMAITINRYILIFHPILYTKIYQKKNLAVMLAAIWSSPLIILTPTYLGKWGCFGLDPENDSCNIVPLNYQTDPRHFLYITVIVVSCTLITFCYARIFLKVRRVIQKSKNNKQKNPNTCMEKTTGHYILIKAAALTNDSAEGKTEGIPLKVITNSNSEYFESPNGTSCDTEKKKQEPSELPKIRRNVFQRSLSFVKFSLPTHKDKRLGTVIAAIMTSFCICYLPSAFIEILRGITSRPALNIASYVLLYFSSCINPVVYVAMSKEYQKAYKHFLRCFSYKKN